MAEQKRQVQEGFAGGKLSGRKCGLLATESWDVP